MLCACSVCRLIAAHIQLPVIPEDIYQKVLDELRGDQKSFHQRITNDNELDQYLLRVIVICSAGYAKKEDVMLPIYIQNFGYMTYQMLKLAADQA